eukprot:734297-Pleurochrysis_carterae.AAC.9
MESSVAWQNPLQQHYTRTKFHNQVIPRAERQRGKYAKENFKVKDEMTLTSISLIESETYLPAVNFTAPHATHPVQACACDTCMLVQCLRALAVRACTCTL